MEGKASQGKAWQCKARQGQARQCKARQGKARQQHFERSKRFLTSCPAPRPKKIVGTLLKKIRQEITHLFGNPPAQLNLTKKRWIFCRTQYLLWHNIKACQNWFSASKPSILVCLFHYQFISNNPNPA